MFGKKLPGKPKLPKTFDIYGCKIQNLKVDSVLTAYPADTRKAYCEVCNNAIIGKHCELEKSINLQQLHSIVDNFKQSYSKVGYIE